MKKILLGIFIGILVVSMTACKGDILETDNKTPKGMIHEHCTRSGNIDNNSSTDLSYEIYYTDGVLNKIESIEKVISTSSSTLDEYENAYRQIHSYYEGLAYYTAKVTRTSTSVTSEIVIDYDNIDIQKLIDIEGEEDNIFENGVPKIEKYKELAKKVGMQCTQVS